MAQPGNTPMQGRKQGSSSKDSSSSRLTNRRMCLGKATRSVSRRNLSIHSSTPGLARLRWCGSTLLQPSKNQCFTLSPAGWPLTTLVELRPLLWIASHTDDVAGKASGALPAATTKPAASIKNDLLQKDAKLRSRLK